MASIALAALLATAGSTHPQPVVMFSSDAIQIARDAAIEWNRAPLPKNAAFDIPDNPTAVQPGFYHISYIVGVRNQLTIWINLTTGQVVEPDRCIYFHSRKILSFAASIRKLTGARPIALDDLANQIGCDALKPD